MRRQAFLILGLLLGAAAQPACTRALYQPTQEHFFEPSIAKLPFDEVWLDAEDGVKLHAWLFPARKDAPRRGTVVQFHGNAQNISTHFGSLYWLTEQGFDLFAFDYRGYGWSDGEPTQPGTVRDGIVALQYAFSRSLNGQSSDIVLYGQSLGGAVLPRAFEEIRDPAQRARVKAVVIDSSFYSYHEVARDFLTRTWVTFLLQPLAYFLVSNQYGPADSIPRISPIPLLVIHGDRDRVVPLEYGRKIYDLAKEPKEFWMIPRGVHIDSMSGHAGRYRAQFLKYLDSILKPG